MIPKRLQRIADSLGLGDKIGRCYDSTGKHVSFYYASKADDPTWRIYRHSVPGMILLLRMVAKHS